MPYIYKIKNNLTNEFYIGKTYNVEKRFNKHKSNALCQHKNYLYDSMRKFGIENFTLNILEETSKETQNTREKYYIEKLKPTLNMTDGGDGGSTTHNYMWINNGKKNQYILKTDVIPKGYIKGRLGNFRDPNFQREMGKRGHDAMRLIPYEIRKKSIEKAIKTKIKNNTLFRDISGDKNPTRKAEVREKIRINALKRIKLICHKCGKAGVESPGMYRWHFNNCKNTNDDTNHN